MRDFVGEHDARSELRAGRAGIAPFPAAVTALSLGAGILVDALAELRTEYALLAALTCITGWALCRRADSPALATMWVCGVWMCTGCAAHHLAWSTVSSRDIAARAARVSAPVQLVGTVSSRPIVRGAARDGPSALPQFERTICFVDVERVIEAGDPLPADGRVQLIVRGHALVEPGDRVSVRGRIQRPRSAGNPGEFDYRHFLRRRGAHAVVRVHDPLAVSRIRRAAAWRPVWWRNRARRIASDILQASLHADIRPLAAGILLGERDAISADVRDAFIESGTMHLLAISGLHVGILAVFLLRVTCLLRLRPGHEVLVVVVFVAAYVAVTDVRPSVLRAAALVLSLVTGRMWYRSSGVVNSLGTAALVVLLIDPTVLFDVGAQLSFLAVSAIAWVNCTATGQPPNIDITQSAFSRALRWITRAALRDARVILTVSLVTAPLVAHAFHLWAPVGMLMNLLLIHLIAVAMIAGFATLATGFLVPVCAGLPASVFAGTLHVLQKSANLASDLPLGHRYGPAPSVPWLLTFYALLAVVAMTRGRWPARARRALVAVVIIGLVGGAAGPGANELRCTVLDVGHGSCALIETPGGRTLVIDSGSMGGPDRAAGTLQECLWSRGFWQIDSLAITHADLDHFNGVGRLIVDTPIGCVTGSAEFYSSGEKWARRLRQTLRARAIPRVMTGRGERFAVDDDVSVEVLHPPRGGGGQFDDDNAASLVLLIRYAGRRILLTGDVSGAGLRELMACPIAPVDLMVVPHHGGRAENRTELNAWAQPGIVVASSRRPETIDVLREVYPTARRFVTAVNGAVICTVTPQGDLGVSAFRR